MIGEDVSDCIDQSIDILMRVHFRYGDQYVVIAPWQAAGEVIAADDSVVVLQAVQHRCAIDWQGEDKLLEEFGHPIISTSAGYDDPYDIRDAYGFSLEAIVDGGILYPSPSSVISLINDVPEVIREGKGDVSSFL